MNKQTKTEQDQTTERLTKMQIIIKMLKYYENYRTPGNTP